ncbi:LANO_0F03378g1_1 [Lachancea nothofagi CBS 11611]|uniref:LANO_0F03378g1_1 n=1 Tax=Lachancea nothofagi CBS 11611 TaxID=1266666 RepID=A0A1G4K748_9SACH|nr:LANO_0F03378g1_1 [Lachancea nothofagi CBS 11611]
MSLSKKAKLSMPKQICTHSGSFHADEALAVYILRILPEYKDAKVVRSRDPVKWEESDIVVDVSGKYDSKHGLFDHHQREFFETFSESYKTKLSSAGLVYKHFGQNIIKTLQPQLKESQVDFLYEKVYRDFIESLDANDNGISNFDSEELGVKPKFHDKNITIPGIVSGMNPNWNEDSSDASFDKCFFKASDFIGGVFVNLVKGYGESWMPAKTLVEEAVQKRFEVDPSGKIIVLTQFCPWKEHLYAIEREQGIENEILFVLFADSSGKWRVSTVSVSATSFNFRKGLPEPLRGLRDDELSEKSGLPGCIFIHAAGFIGGASSKETVLKLAQMSL